MDNASTHPHIEPAVLEPWLVKHRFVLLYLLPRSPKLNLIEILWRHAKYHWRAFTSWTKDPAIVRPLALSSGIYSDIWKVTIYS